MRIIALIALVGVVGCVPENGPLMRPGENCLRCHGGSEGGPEGGEEDDAKPWSLAGTVYATIDARPNEGVEGAQVQVTDARGFSFQLETNQAGNFYSAEAVTFPLRVCVERHGQLNCMDGPAPHGACNFCHAPGSGAVGDPRRIAAP